MIADEAAARTWLHARDDCDDRAWECLHRLVSLLAAENTAQNLVSAASLDDVWRRHVADSAQLLDHVPEKAGSWLDIGSGAGFPGLVVAILRPDIPVTLVERRSLRGEWLERAAALLGLVNVTVLAAPITAIPQRSFAAISARAFAPLPRLIDLSARFSTPATAWTLPKGRSARQELTTLAGWTHMFHVERSLTDAESGIIVGRLTGRSERG